SPSERRSRRNAETAEDHRYRAEAGKGGLQHVDTDEHGEPDEERRNGERQHHGEKRHGAGKGENGTVEGHGTSLLGTIFVQILVCSKITSIRAIADAGPPPHPSRPGPPLQIRWPFRASFVNHGGTGKRGTRE